MSYSKRRQVISPGKRLVFQYQISKERSCWLFFIYFWFKNQCWRRVFQEKTHLNHVVRCGYKRAYVTVFSMKKQEGNRSFFAKTAFFAVRPPPSSMLRSRAFFIIFRCRPCASRSISTLNGGEGVIIFFTIFIHNFVNLKVQGNPEMEHRRA